MGSVGGFVVRALSADDAEALQYVEVRAGQRFRGVGMADIAEHDPPSAAAFAEWAEAGLSWVAVSGAGGAGARPVGYVVVEDHGGADVHVEQISVDPDWQGRGVGRALLERVRVAALGAGKSGLTLTTFTDVPWNRPLYEHLGFRVLPEDELTPELRHVREADAAFGLDPAQRCCMRLDVRRPLLP